MKDTLQKIDQLRNDLLDAVDELEHVRYFLKIGDMTEAQANQNLTDIIEKIKAAMP